MKKLAKLASFATLLAFGALSVAASPVKVPGTEDEGKKNFIVTLDAAPGINGDKERSKVLNELAYKLPEDSYKILDEYDTVLNGFAIETYSDVAGYIEENIPGISSVSVEHTYAAPETAETTAEGGLLGDYAEEKLGNYSAETIDATKENVESAIAARGGDSEAQLGKGITIGIIDSGLILNQVEGSAERNETASNLGGASKLNPAAFVDLPSTEDYNVLSDADIKASNLSHGYTRVNNKVAYAYDYAGNDPDVDPEHVDGVHGTHVASLAAANGTAFQGIAPNAQLAVMKVFPDNASGAGESAIIAALNDAAKLKLDVVNLSLGTDLLDDEASPTDTSSVYAAIQGCVDAGVIVNYAAGNSGKSSFSSSQGYSDYTTDTVETSILGSSSLFDERANVVASTNPDKAFFKNIMTVGEGSSAVAVSYDDQVINRENSTIQVDFDLPLAKTLLEGDYNTNDGQFNYVRIGGVGEQEDYDDFFAAHADQFPTKSLDGYIAVIERGETTFRSKAETAIANGAIALIVINDNPSVTFNFSFDWADYSPTIPVVLVFQNVGSSFGSVNSIGTLSIAENSVENAPDGNITSSFSSDGPSYDLDIDPTIAAPGSAVIGAIAAEEVGATSELMGYDNMSGTSMATPNFTGALASILSEKKPENNGYLASDSDVDFAKYKKVVSSMVMSSANPVNDNTGKNIASPRIQGAGNVNVHDTLLNESYITTTVNADNADDWNTVGTEVAKAELKNAGSLKTDLSKDSPAYIEFSYTVHNDSNINKTYTPSLSLMIPDLRVQITKSEYDDNLANDPSQVADIPDNLPNTITMSINDEPITLDDQHQVSGSIPVNAHSTATGSVKVRIDDIQFHKDFVPEEQRDEVPSFDGTLREYFNKYFNYEGGAGGSYVEGYLTLEENSDTSADKCESLSLPYMGFYGDYTKGEAVEPFEFEKTEGHLYNSEMIDTYMANVSSRTVQRANAYTGSTLSATNSFSGSDMMNIADMKSSALAGSSNKYVSVEGPATEPAEGENRTLYAGAEGTSDVLAATFFVNRSIKDNSWTIRKGNQVKDTGKLADYTADGMYANDGTLYRSILLTGTTGYAIHRAYAAIPLKDLDEGEYTLEFSFTLRATGTVQTKTYNLIIDKTAPELVSSTFQTTSSGRTQLSVVSRGGEYLTAFGASVNQTTRVVPTKVEGSDDLYQTNINITDAMLEADKVVVTFYDYAYNTATYIIHPSNVGTTIEGDGLDANNDFYFDLINQDDSGYLFDFTLLDEEGQPYTDFEGKLTLNFYLGTGLDIGTPLASAAAEGNSTQLQEIVCTVNGADATAIYDPSTGYASLTFNLEGGYASISIPLEIQNPSELPSGDSSSTPGSGDSSNNSSSTPGSNDSSSSTGGENNPSNPTDGLQGWQIALIAIGAVIGVGIIGGVVYFLFIKKKNKK